MLPIYYYYIFPTCYLIYRQQVGNLHRTISVRCGLLCPYFSYHVQAYICGSVPHKGTKAEILVLFQRENLFSIRGFYYQNFRELSGKQTCSDTGRRARNPVEDSERAQSHHDTEWDEARGKSKSRSCAVIERDDGRINHNSYSTGVIFRSGVVTRE